MSIGGRTGAATVFVDVEGDLTKFRKDLDGAATQTTSAFNKATKVAGAAAVGAAVGITVAAAKTFVDFQKGITEVYTLLPEASAALRTQLSEDAKAVSTEFGQELGVVTTAMYDSISAGIPAGEVKAFLSEAGKLAIGGATDIGTAVDGLTGVINAYGAENISAAEASDILFGTVKAGKTTVDELSSKIAAVTPIASTLGLSFDQVGAAFAAVTATTGNTAEASTQLRGVLAELSKDGAKAFTEFGAATGQTFKEFVAGGGTLGEAMLLLQDHAVDAGLGLGDMFGSVEAGGAALILAKDGAGKFTDSLTSIQDGAGATGAAYEEMNGTLSVQLDKVKASLSVAALNIGETIAPALADLAGGLSTFSTFLAELPGPVSTLAVGLLALGGGLLFLAGPIMKAVQLFKMMSTVMAANPWLLLAIAVVAIAFLIYKNWDAISAFLSDTWEAIKGALDAAWTWIKTTTETVWNAISSFFSTWWPLLLGIFLGPIGLIVGLVIKNWDAIKTKTVEIWDAISSKIGEVAGAIYGFVQDKIISPVESLIGFFADLPGKAVTAWEGVKSAIANVAEWIKTKLGEIGAAADKALGPLDEILSVGAKIGGGIIGGIGGVLGFDEGGVVPGPKGSPRLILAHSGETILPTHKDPNAGMGGAGGAVTNVYLSDATIRNDDDIVRLARMLAEEQDRTRRAAGGLRR